MKSQKVDAGLESRLTGEATRYAERTGYQEEGARSPSSRRMWWKNSEGCRGIAMIVRVHDSEGRDRLTPENHTDFYPYYVSR